MILLALMAQTGGSKVQEIASTFGVDWPHLTAQMISFAIVCAILYWFAYQPVLTMLETRRRQIALGLENAAKINAALAGIEAQRQDVIAGAQAQAQQLIADARDTAKRLLEQESRQAIATAEQIVARAPEGATQEHTRMLADLRREVGRLVVQTTAAVSGKVLTPDHQPRLAADTSKRLASS